jgi:adenine deaminase
MRVALGREPADTILKGGVLVDVNIGKAYPADVAIKADRIAFVGDCEHTAGPGTEVFDASNRYLTPAFFDCHLHATGCQVSMTELAKALIAHGTTVICTDLYEAAILGGLHGMRFCLDELNNTPLKTLISVGYQMYVQNRDLGNTGKISADEMMAVLDWPETIGISEWLLWFWSDPEDHEPIVQKLFEEVWERKMMLVGHAHTYPTKDVAAYASVGSSSDHEANSDEDALEKLQAGYRIMMKENASIHNTEKILPLVAQRGIDARNLMWNSDHSSPAFLLRKGNVDAYIREAIRLGLNPITAVQMGSLNAAEYFGLSDDLGSIAPGRFADIVLVNNLEDFQVKEVFANGQLVAKDGDYIALLDAPAYPEYFYQTINVGRSVKAEEFEIRAPDGKDEAKVRIIGIPYPVTRTEPREAVMRVEDGRVPVDLARDIIKITVLDRHHASGNTAVAFIQGIGIERGAYGTSYHAGIEDIGIVGTNDRDIAAVANCLIEMGGGAAVAVDGEVFGKVEMPLLGLMPTDSLQETVAKWEHTNRMLLEHLKPKNPTPWRALGFPCMPRAIPRYKICQAGLVDVTPRSAELIPLFVED